MIGREKPKNCLLLIVIIGFNTAIHPVARRSMVFEDIRVGRRLVNNILETEKTSSKTVCAKMCGKELECLSFNFCGWSTCELNSKDIFSNGKEGGSAVLQKDSHCIYMGMQAEEVPTCEQGSVERDIQDDSSPNKCEINGKRTDAVWGEWEIINDGIGYEWKSIMSQSCEVAAHGGIETCQGVSEARVLDWLKWDIAQWEYSNAKVFCEDEGGSLFSNVYGTQEQIWFLEDIVNKPEYFVWLGIEKANDSNIWTTISGQEVSPETFYGYTAYLYDPSSPEENLALSIHYGGIYAQPRSSIGIPLCDMLARWSKCICSMNHFLKAIHKLTFS